MQCQEAQAPFGVERARLTGTGDAPEDKIAQVGLVGGAPVGAVPAGGLGRPSPSGRGGGTKAGGCFWPRWQVAQVTVESSAL